MTTRATVALCLLAAPGLAQDAPQVKKLTPPHQTTDVDATKTKTLVAEFDSAMAQRGWSFCGGGPTFPKLARPPEWKDDHTVVLHVVLEPDHSYSMSLNCPGAKSFRSAKGVPLTPTPWSFTTAPARKLSKAEQLAINDAAFARLQEVLATAYSYLDHHGIDWQKNYEEHAAAILDSKSTRAWVDAAGKLLRPTNDIHLYLKYKDLVVGAGQRRTDPLIRQNLLGNYLAKTSRPCPDVLAGETEDGIGYLMIPSFTDRVDFAALEKLIESSGAKALVIDVRPNSGGGENLAQQVARHFVAGNKIYAKNRFRIGRGGDGFGKVLTRRIRGKPDGGRFGRPVAVLMSRYCMSSCEAFLLMMKQAEDCRLIGQTSYGSSGNPKRHVLPNGVEIFVPSWQAMRPDGTCFENQGIAPDVEVAATAKDLETRDPILERALAHLRGKLR